MRRAGIVVVGVRLTTLHGGGHARVCEDAKLDHADQLPRIPRQLPDAYRAQRHRDHWHGRDGDSDPVQFPLSSHRRRATFSTKTQASGPKGYAPVVFHYTSRNAHQLDSEGHSEMHSNSINSPTTSGERAAKDLDCIAVWVDSNVCTRGELM